MLSEWDAAGRLEHEAARSLQRLLPRLRAHSPAHSPSGEWAAFEARLQQQFQQPNAIATKPSQ
jgi:hypothetical protein